MIYSHSYVTPIVVETCSINKCKHNKSWIVQLAMGTKRKVSEMVEICLIELNGLSTWERLNIFYLVFMMSSLIWIGWKKLKLNLIATKRNFDCIDEDGNSRIVGVIPIEIFIRNISTLQLRKCFRKGCQFYVAHVLNLNKIKFQILNKILCCNTLRKCSLMKYQDSLHRGILISQLILFLGLHQCLMPIIV